MIWKPQHNALNSVSYSVFCTDWAPFVNVCCYLLFIWELMGLFSLLNEHVLFIPIRIGRYKTWIFSSYSALPRFLICAPFLGHCCMSSRFGLCLSGWEDSSVCDSGDIMTRENVIVSFEHPKKPVTFLLSIVAFPSFTLV